jgi:monoamine oxidase
LAIIQVTASNPTTTTTMTTFASSEYYFESLPLPANGRAPNPSSYPETPETSLSYWQREFRDTISEGLDKTALPSNVDVVIIGTGVTGAAAAYRLAKEEPGLTVAVVEARGFCSGATGRNGGHICRPEAYEFRALAESLGAEDAAKVKRVLTQNRDIMLGTIEELGIADEVDLRLGGTIEVFKDQEQLDNYIADDEAAQKSGYHAEATMMSADEARKVSTLRLSKNGSVQSQNGQLTISSSLNSETTFPWLVLRTLREAARYGPESSFRAFSAPRRRRWLV